MLYKNIIKQKMILIWGMFCGEWRGELEIEQTGEKGVAGRELGSNEVNTVVRTEFEGTENKKASWWARLIEAIKVII